MWQRIKIFLYVAIGMFVIYNACFRKEEVDEVPTEGLITTVKEVEAEKFKIEDEQPAVHPDSSLIIAKYLDGKIDTFTLEEARLVEAGGGASSGLARAAMMAAGAGFLGYMMGRSMSSRPSPAAYTNQGTYDRVNNSTGNRLHSTASRTPKSRSGFGGGRSTRSFGG
jgi:hypothetical protein